MDKYEEKYTELQYQKTLAENEIRFYSNVVDLAKERLIKINNQIEELVHTK